MEWIRQEQLKLKHFVYVSAKLIVAAAHMLETIVRIVRDGDNSNNTIVWSAQCTDTIQDSLPDTHWMQSSENDI